MDKKEFDLDQPSVPDQEEADETATDVEKEEEQAPVEPEKAEETEVETEDDSATTVEADPPRVPYSRFESVNEARVRAEEQLRIMQAERAQEQLAQAAAPTDTGLPTYWVELYGDSDASKRAYQLRQQEIKEEREQLRQGLREDFQREQVEQEQRVDTTVEQWSNSIDDYAAKNKRTFTEADTDALLDVMDELTPKDENGNYIVEPIQYLDRAVELHDLRQDKAKNSARTSRQATARLTSAKSEGVPTSKPGEWDGNWEKKLSKMGL